MITDISHWTEVTRGIYRYVVAAKVCYEIHINYWSHTSDIQTANATLFLAGDWKSQESSYFERECLLESQPVFECLKAAERDYKENIA